jgi:hypothetical protein
MTMYQPPQGVPRPLAPQNHTLPPPPPDQAQRHRGGGRSRVVVGTVVVLTAVFGAGLGGVLVGAHLNRTSPAATATPPTSPQTPKAEQVRAATVDLCTRFAAGMRAIPIPQKTGFDVIPTINYITTALADNPAADSEIRAAVADELRLQRDQASAFSHEPAAGAIQPAPGWTADQSNDAVERVFKLCRAYQG